ncbi:MAG: hypothetical protein AAF571_12725, partial [Verrucomicrobiota bacterium]
MFKPSATIHKSPAGEVKVLECSEDAQLCLEAYLNCEDPGELIYIRQGSIEKHKKWSQQDIDQWKAALKRVAAEKEAAEKEAAEKEAAEKEAAEKEAAEKEAAEKEAAEKEAAEKEA